MHFIGVNQEGTLSVIDDKMVKEWTMLPNGKFEFVFIDGGWSVLNSDMVVVEGEIAISYDISKE